MSKNSNNKSYGVLISILACISLMSCRHPVQYYILPNFIEEDGECVKDRNISDFSIDINDWPSSFSCIWASLSFESDSCFEINEHDIYATIGNDTLRFDSWKLLYNKDSINNRKLFITPSCYKGIDADNLGSTRFPLARKLYAPQGKNTLFCVFYGNKFSAPIRISALLRGVKMSPVVIGLKPEKAIMYYPDDKFVKWDENIIVRENDSICVCLSRQPLKNDSCELLCLLYFDAFGKPVTNNCKNVKNQKDLSMSHIDINLDNIDLCLADTSFYIDVLNDYSYHFFNPFFRAKGNVSQVHVPFKIKRKDGGPIDYIPDLILSPKNLLLNDEKPLLTDSIIFNGTKAPFIW